MKSTKSIFIDTLTPLAGGNTCRVQKMLYLDAELKEKLNNAHKWYELGCYYNREGRYKEAIHAMQCCLVLSPYSLSAQIELASGWSGIGELGQAGLLLENIISQDPGNGLAYFQLAMVRYQMNILHEATALWECAARLLDDPSDTLENLAMAYRRMGDSEKEKCCWQRLKDFSVDHPAVMHMLAAHGQSPVRSKADEVYLRHLFDNFAPHFDIVLKWLQYSVPDLVEKCLYDINGPPVGTLKIVDAGCGTGLCGERLRPWAQHLTGVDISSGVLVEAGQRNIYDNLVESELTAYFKDSNNQRCNWIVAGDMFCYFGKLEEIIELAVDNLTGGGRLFLTVEKDEEHQVSVEKSYRLQSHGRYCHTQDYIEKLAKMFSTSLEKISTEILRYESGKPVKGICAVFHKV